MLCVEGSTFDVICDDCGTSAHGEYDPTDDLSLREMLTADDGWVFNLEHCDHSLCSDCYQGRQKHDA